jgi:hypothetical protein
VCFNPYMHDDMHMHWSSNMHVLKISHSKGGPEPVWPLLGSVPGREDPRWWHYLFRVSWGAWTGFGEHAGSGGVNVQTIRLFLGGTSKSARACNGRKNYTFMRNDNVNSTYLCMFYSSYKISNLHDNHDIHIISLRHNSQLKYKKQNSYKRNS